MSLLLWCRCSWAIVLESCISKMKKIGFATLGAVMIYALLSNDQNANQSSDMHASTDTVSTPRRVDQSNKLRSEHQLNQWGHSPFDLGNATSRPNQQIDDGEFSNATTANDEYANRQSEAEAPYLMSKMERFGYAIPADIVHKSEVELRKLAGDGNNFAKITLAEKLMYADHNQVDKKIAITESKKLLSEAFNAGNIKSASLLANAALLENKVLDSLTWNYVAEKLGDTFASETFRNSETFFEANERLKQDAIARAETILIEIRRRP